MIIGNFIIQGWNSFGQHDKSSVSLDVFLLKNWNSLRSYIGILWNLHIFLSNIWNIHMLSCIGGCITMLSLFAFQDKVLENHGFGSMGLIISSRFSNPPDSMLLFNFYKHCFSLELYIILNISNLYCNICWIWIITLQLHKKAVIVCYLDDSVTFTLVMDMVYLCSLPSRLCIYIGC